MRTLWRLVHALDVRSKWMERNLGVTGPQRLVMRMVGRHPGIGAGDLASKLDLHPSTLTGILARLEARAYLVRLADPADRRRACFRLTAAGAGVDAERKGTVEAAVRRALTRSAELDVEHTEAVLAILVTELERDESAERARPRRPPAQRRKST